MAGLYQVEGTSNDYRHVKVEGLTLFELLTSRDCSVDGIKFLQRGSTEWGEAMQRFRHLLQQMNMPPDDIERSVAVRSTKDPLVVQTGFSCIRYLRQGDRGGHPFQVFVADETLDLLCGIVLGEKKVIILPYKCKDGQPEERYFHNKSEASWGGNQFYYDGGLRESLQPFQEQRFVFHKGIWAGHYGGRKPVVHPESVSLDEIFKGN